MHVMGICVGGRSRRMGGVQKALLRAPDTGESLVARLVRIGREAGHEVVLLGAADLGTETLGALQLPDAALDLGPLAGLQNLLAHACDRSAICVACDMPYVTPALLARLTAEPLQAEASASHTAQTRTADAPTRTADAAAPTRAVDAAAPTRPADAAAPTRAVDAAAQRLLDAAAPLRMDAQVLAPRDAASGKWHAMFARYDSASVAPLLARAWADGERSFQGLFKRLTARELLLDEIERAQLRDWDTPEDMREP